MLGPLSQQVHRDKSLEAEYTLLKCVAMGHTQAHLPVSQPALKYSRHVQSTAEERINTVLTDAQTSGCKSKSIRILLYANTPGDMRSPEEGEED